MSIPRHVTWKTATRALMVAGAAGAVLSATLDLRQFAFSWLLAFLFFLSLSLGALFFLAAHHLCDAAWSAPIRRLLEHTACFLFPWLAVAFLPVGFLAGQIYPAQSGSRALFWVASLICLGVWTVMAHQLRRRSLEQDAAGTAICALRMRAWSAGGAAPAALALALASALWIESVSGAWRSTIYGAWFFAASAWVALPTVYFLAVALRRSGHLREVLPDRTLFFLGSLMLAFTLFHAYISYSRFFIVWNGNLPAETAWYAARGQGNWRAVAILLIFGHCVAPFLLLLRNDWKSRPALMLPFCAWAWAMHLLDLQFQIMPALHPGGPANLWSDAACLALFAGAFGEVLRRALMKSSPYPMRDPRLAEALGIHAPPTTGIATASQRGP